MRHTSFVRSFAAALSTISMVAACGGGGTGTTEQLAADQTLSFPMVDDIGDLDPALLQAAVDVLIFRNVFSGLYKFDDQLNQVPDIATGPPAVSSDNLTYTFKLRHEVKFSNGDPVKADDFIFSWDRAARIQGTYASVFQPVAGYEDVAGGKATHMTGLKKIDDYSFSATLGAPAGYWYTELALWTAYVVDKKVVDAAGDTKWWTDPATLIGTGPFKMTARTPKQSADFAPVSNWWAGSTGALTKVHIEILADQKAQLTKYESGGYSLIGFGNQLLTPEDVIRYNSDPQLKKQLQLVPASRTTWIGFNFCEGAGKPVKTCTSGNAFAGDPGKLGREAFSLAVDRDQLVDIACSKGTACVKATGGVITKGLKGYLGDNTDPWAMFDKAKAMSLYKQWDPEGSKVKNLIYTYNTTAFNKAVCENLASQWKANLGVTVQCAAQDRASFFSARNNCRYPIFRHSWGADYDHPQDWFDFLFVSSAGSSGSCYATPQVDQMVAQANAKPLSQSLDTYKAINKILVDNTVTGNLVYSVQQYLVHDYVKGASGNALYDNYWSDVKILQH
ncbi:MAG TPA: peptide ABC transporter substrate-binding protein [Candidatus Dormibacteraeota bacterium]|nr:peptide ABC transporter substrate-binding protein [Candidatus Dormibacteraeota bacterium]